MGEQRGLLDKTFRGQQGEAVKPKDLQKEQGDIKKQLDEILKGLGGQKIPAPNDLGRAGRSMGQSEQDLGSNDLPGSSVDQKNALDALRSAANDLANKLMQQMGQDQPDRGDEDPLGRKEGANGSSVNGDVKVPDASRAAARARHPDGTAPPRRRTRPPATGTRLHRPVAEAVLGRALAASTRDRILTSGEGRGSRQLARPSVRRIRPI